MTLRASAFLKHNGPGQSMRIMVVDDSETFRSYLKSMLLAAGYADPIMADSANQAFEILEDLCRDQRAALPDLILMDIKMPSMDGIEATRLLKSDPRLMDIPVIMVTVSDEDDNLDEAFNAGATDYITKPLRKLELLARVGAALRLKLETDERKAREWDLLCEKEFVSVILENSYDGIAVVGKDGVFTFVSPGMERIFGYPADSYSTIFDWIVQVFPDNPPSKETVASWLCKGKSGHEWLDILPYTPKDRQQRWCRIHFSYMHNANLVLNIQDVTVFEKQKLELMQRQNRHMQDLEAAAEIQQSLLPRRFGLSESFKFAWEFHPCSSIGGDIFNVFPLGPRHIGMYMLDVSGHGVASSLVALSVYNFMHYQRSTLVDRSGGGIRVVDPEIVIRRLDKEFPYEKFSRFFTIAYMTLDLTTGQVIYCNAGHPSPAILSPDGRLVFLEERGTIVGLDGFTPFNQRAASLAPGDKIILYSDGLPELRNHQGEFYGEERFESLLQAEGRRPVLDLVELVNDSLTAFAGAAPPQDDVSILGVEYVQPRKT